MPKGLALGFVTSQPLANFLLTELDHLLKEKLHVKHSARFMDDMAIFGSSKKFLHKVRAFIKEYLSENLHLRLKDDWQVFLMDGKWRKKGRFLDFLGYKFYRDHLGIRRKIALKIQRKAKHIFKKLIPNVHDARQMVTYGGIAKVANCRKWFREHVLKYVSVSKLKKQISWYDKHHNSKRRRNKLPCGTNQKRQPLRRSLIIPQARNGCMLERTSSRNSVKTKPLTRLIPCMCTTNARFQKTYTTCSNSSSLTVTVYRILKRLLQKL